MPVEKVQVAMDLHDGDSVMASHEVLKARAIKYGTDRIEIVIVNPLADMDLQVWLERFYDWARGKKNSSILFRHSRSLGKACLQAPAARLDHHSLVSLTGLYPTAERELNAAEEADLVLPAVDPAPTFFEVVLQRQQSSDNQGRRSGNRGILHP